MFENLNDKDMFEKYFPAKSPVQDAETSQPVSCHCTQHRCCTPPPCQGQSKCRCQGNQAAKEEILPIIRELSERVSKIQNDTAAIKADLSALPTAEAIKPKSRQQPDSSPLATPLSPVIIVADNVPSQLTPVHQEPPHSEHNCSSSSDSNTIDEYVFGDVSMNSSSHLNSNVPTNQLHQLMQSQPPNL